MVNLVMPMGTFHIIDGEKVSVRYRGQVKSCARCHQPENYCPGKAMARECNAERVLLSTHMKLHWDNIGFKPENNSGEDVDEDDGRDLMANISELELDTFD